MRRDIATSIIVVVMGLAGFATVRLFPNSHECIIFGGMALLVLYRVGQSIYAWIFNRGYRKGAKDTIDRAVASAMADPDNVAMTALVHQLRRQMPVSESDQMPDEWLGNI